MSMEPKRRLAAQMLVLANAGWGLSFPTVKALVLVQQPLVPDAGTWFLSSLTVAYRFGLAALVMLLLCLRTLGRMTRLEFWEGFVLGVVGATGLLFQMDGLPYTKASTSAFLTQFYCLLIPLLVALRVRRLPSGVIVLSCLLVLAGVAVLCDINWRDLRVGRGEAETIIASTIFTGQILWLQRPKFSVNNVNHFTLVMFTVTALVCAPVAWITTPASGPGAWLTAFQTPATWLVLAILAVFCTLGSYRLMNRWQPYLTATQAGLLYCLEPVFATVFALFLPGLFSAWAGIQYPNEHLTSNLLIGGLLITAANVLIQTKSHP
jgi:drug/metabolite transporter (DMT)-like permease